MLHLEITEVVSFHYKVVKNNYQQDSRVLYAFVPDILFGQLLDSLQLKSLQFYKPLIQNFHILKYGLLI